MTSFAKFIFSIVILSASTQALAATFSAFSVGDDLYVTILGDSCNNFSGHLRVEETCLEGRRLKNRALTCSAQLTVIATRKGCMDNKAVPRVLTLSLNENKVAHEARLLELVYGNERVEIELNQ